MWKWKTIKHLIISNKIANDVMKIMQLGFIMTTIREVSFYKLRKETKKTFKKLIML